MNDREALWLAHQRRRWMLPDPSRWLQPDQSKWVKPGVKSDPLLQLFECKYRADQPRVPAGNSDGGQWTSGGSGVVGRNDPRVISDATPDNEWKPGTQYAQNRSGRGTVSVRINGRMVDVEPGQAARLAVAESDAQAAFRRVREIDPNWRPTPSFQDTIEGSITTAKEETREAEARLNELARMGIGPGPFAGDSIPARERSRRLTEEERNELNRIGSKSGCNTCGTFDPGTPLGNWVGDHQYPNALNPLGRPQRLYPQCATCSATQGGWVRSFKATR